MNTLSDTRLNHHFSPTHRLLICVTQGTLASIVRSPLLQPQALLRDEKWLLRMLRLVILWWQVKYLNRMILQWRATAKKEKSSYQTRYKTCCFLLQLFSNAVLLWFKVRNVWAPTLPNSKHISLRCYCLINMQLQSNVFFSRLPEDVRNRNS